jgi:hypothetical protein
MQTPQSLKGAFALVLKDIKISVNLLALDHIYQMPVFTQIGGNQ